MCEKLLTVIKYEYQSAANKTRPGMIIRRSTDSVQNPLCFRRSFQVSRNEKFYLTLVFKNITHDTEITRIFVQRLLNDWSRDIVRYRSAEIAQSFGCFLVRYQDFIEEISEDKWHISTFRHVRNKDGILNALCDVFRLRPYNLDTSFTWSNRFYNAIATLNLDDIEGFRIQRSSKWDFCFYLSGLPNMSAIYDFNCNIRAQN